MPYSPDISDYAAIYHWWSHSEDKRVCRNLSYPIILSIATLRVQNPNLSIYVIDCSDDEYDWEDYPARLDFSVIRQKSAVERVLTRREMWSQASGRLYAGRGPLSTAIDALNDIDILDVRMSSKPLDVWALSCLLPERYILFCDCDVFWMKPLLPLANGSDTFSICDNNSGVYYFDKTEKSAIRWFRLWEAFTLLAVKDFDLRREMMSLYPFPNFVHDEKILFYVRDLFPEVYEAAVTAIPPWEVLLPGDVGGSWADFETLVKSAHVTLKFMGCNRGRFPLFFREMFDGLRTIFSIKELHDIFGMTLFNNSLYEWKSLALPLNDKFYANLTSRINA